MTEDGDSNEQGSNSEASIKERLGSSRRTFMKGASAVAGGAALGSTTASAKDQSKERTNKGETKNNAGPTNVILFIGDGQGRSHIDLGRYLHAYQADSEAFPLNVAETPLNIDRHEAHGSATTYPDDPEEFVTDSAAAATAMSTGFKTYNGAIGGIETDAGEFVSKRTVLEEARDQNYALGLVTTARITDATPAAFATHVPDRDQETDIARQYIRESGVDVLFGGGRGFFQPEGRDDGLDLITEAKRNGFSYAETASDLDSLDTAPALGLFSEGDSNLNFVLDRQNDDDSTQPGLVQMTEKALPLLENRGGNQGFFLMVEAASIDKASHPNFPDTAYESLEGDETLGTILDYADNSNAETLVITTADHECGGLSLAVDGVYDVNFDVLDGLKASSDALTTAIGEVDSREQVPKIVSEQTGVDLTESELDELRSDPSTINDILNKRIRLGWTSTGHSGENVPTFAQGPNSEFFDATIDNTDIAGAVRKTLFGSRENNPSNISVSGKSGVNQSS